MLVGERLLPDDVVQVGAHQVHHQVAARGEGRGGEGRGGEGRGGEGNRWRVHPYRCLGRHAIHCTSTVSTMPLIIMKGEKQVVGSSLHVWASIPDTAHVK